MRNKGLEEKLQNSAKEVEGLRTRMETVRKESLTDALTGLANRRSFDEAAYDSALAMIKLPCALWQKTPSTLPDGQSVLFEYTVFPVLDDKANKHQLLILVNHQLAEGGRLDGAPEFKRATIFKWLDLGEGTLANDQSAAA